MNTTLLAIVACTVFGATTFAHAQSQIEVEVSSEVYYEGDTVIISGSINPLLPDTPLLLRILDRDSGLVDIDQISPAGDGRFTYTVVATGPKWIKEGQYIVEARYGEAVNEARFEFKKQEPEEPPKSGRHAVDLPETGSKKDVNYVIKNGHITHMVLNKDQFSLIATILPDGDGNVQIELERGVIDSRDAGQTGPDINYIVVRNGVQVPFEEVASDGNVRTISVDFPYSEGTIEIEIIGTWMIPEFGAAAVLVSAVALAGTALMSRRHMSF